MPVLKPMSDAMAEQYMQIVFETMDLTVDAAWLPEIRNYFMISGSSSFQVGSLRSSLPKIR
ncbi:hypothetical protein A6M27_16675 [Acidithiobacillus thiooxidans]|uniref:Uncharacterized protein n=1 Tax=Acidithiobacillus thiooxidans TaxID=930 RepID=A0A1C2I7K5_ACITH|nr:hypothetical protein [Acidithiobacillus thiooxidans]OCX71981.1 hypothetical protein A6O24_14680 [Acidithiobacillus thiooxidans]OCX72545.1 hypothetical protein A6P07_09550 [Acidithiobacillus thiooxidans]OCX79333.1 hypothetical protein A6O26_16790 [Acidithiobacillus thiooxidans]OCX84074.1 hypothetical protein A6M27_16675 [Acidithiobacillus thiooxidans]OFC40546.1 hypothetical protein BAE47_20215 [Acidithiobacillus thiooxidans]